MWLLTLEAGQPEVIVVATGAGDDYWGGQNLPSVFKHTLLDGYVPQFAGMTGSRSTEKRVVFLDGYAGRGRYADGTPRFRRADHEDRSAAVRDRKPRASTPSITYSATTASKAAADSSSCSTK